MNETADGRKLTRANGSAQPVLKDVPTPPSPPFSGYNEKVITPQNQKGNLNLEGKAWNILRRFRASFSHSE